MKCDDIVAWHEIDTILESFQHFELPFIFKTYLALKHLKAERNPKISPCFTANFKILQKFGLFLYDFFEFCIQKTFVTSIGENRFYHNLIKAIEII